MVIEEPTPELNVSFTVSQSDPTALQVNFTANATGGTGNYTYTWNFGDGNLGQTLTDPNTNYTYGQSGSYPVTLTVDDGETQVTTDPQIVVIEEPTPELNASFTVSQSDPTALQVNFTANATGGTGSYSYIWNFGDGSQPQTFTDPNASYTYPQAGSYPVTLTVDDGETQVTTDPQTVVIEEPTPELNASFTVSQSDPTALQVNFTANATGGTGSYSYIWNFGDGSQSQTFTDPNASYTYLQAGSYPVTLTVDDGETQITTDPQTVVIEEPTPELNASFSVSQSDPTALQVGFTANATGGTGSYSYIWNFGDGSQPQTFTDPNASYTYSQSGSYPVTLTVDDGETQITTDPQTVVIEEPTPELNVSFTVSQSDPTALQVGFTANATGGTGNYTYTWNFGDGNLGQTLTDPNTNYTYSQSGSYQVTLTVDDGETQITTDPQTVVIEEPTPALNASFTVSQSDPTALQVGFTASATGGTGSYSYIWNFGDGSQPQTFTDPNASYTYPQAGSYPVTLTVDDGETQITTDPQTVVIEESTPALGASFTVSQSDPTALQVSFTANATGGTGSYSYIWNFGDGSQPQTFTDPNASYTYPQAGSYPVTLTVDDGETQITTDPQTVVIEEPTPALNASFTVSQSDPTALQVGFTANATGGTGAYSYIWNFGDGSQSQTFTDPNASYTYPQAGSYPVTLTVDDGETQITTDPQTVVIEESTPALGASFTVSQSDPTALQVGFTASATGGTGAYSYIWNFGDGSQPQTFTDPNASYTYPQAGSYPVTLTVDDGATQITTDPQTVVIEQPSEPLAVTFTSQQDGANPLLYTFVAEATGGSGTYTYSWAFGDTQTADNVPDATISHTYGGAGTYNVQVTVNDGATQAQFTDTVSIAEQNLVEVVPEIAPITGSLQPVYQQGQAQPTPRDPNAFALIGDSTASDTNFLDPLAGDVVVDPSVSSLQAVLDRYRATNSFGQETVVNTAADLIAPSADPACGGASTITCSINQQNAALTIINVGYQDVFNGTDPATFRSNIDQAIQQAKNAGSVPVLMTIYPSNDTTAQTNIAALNNEIISAATTAQVPVINTWRALNNLPGRGLSGNAPSISAQGAGFLSANPDAGANARNVFTLLTLQEIINQVFGG